MRVLLIKTSSLGDVVHTLPALTDAQRALPAIQFDWLVEENFAAIPAWHPAVKHVIPVALRRWRKAPWAARHDPVWQRLRQHLSETPYDVVIDAQGLMKSAWLGLLANGVRCGFDRASVREKLATVFYQRKFSVAKGQHAVERTRQLLAAALHYESPSTKGDYALDRARVKRITETQRSASPTLLFFHGTTWPSKHYPERYWTELAALATRDHFTVLLPWGNGDEHARATRIASATGAIVLPKLSLTDIAAEIVASAGVLCVDSGLGHLACAFEVPTVSIYGATNPDLTSTYGRTQRALAASFPCAPCLQRECTFNGESRAQPACYDTLPPEKVWQQFKQQMSALPTH